MCTDTHAHMHIQTTTTKAGKTDINFELWIFCALVTDLNRYWLLPRGTSAHSIVHCVRVWVRGWVGLISNDAPASSENTTNAGIDTKCRGGRKSQRRREKCQFSRSCQTVGLRSISSSAVVPEQM